MKLDQLNGLLVIGLFILLGVLAHYGRVGAGSELHKPTAHSTNRQPFAPEAFSWEGAVWQSSRSGNWELYYSPFAKDAVQLTNHPAADTLPRLNVGSTKVAFVSDRDGNDEIYVIDIDGSASTRLTADGAKDTLPYWSPDGSKLIFSSQRTGNGDLYLMNADGSTLRRITSDDAEDSYPTWSPDGTQLLWVRLYPVIEDQPQEGELWVANNDGTNARALTGRLRTPARPLISPNGATIALDTDLDQNGFTDLVLMDRNGANVHNLYPGDTGGFHWMGTWAPDSTSLSTTRFFYAFFADGTRVLQYTDITQLCLDDRPGCDLLIPDDPTVMMPDRQLADLRAPVSRVDPLSPFSRLTGFMLGWSGQEYGPSGLVGFDVQYRREGESTWQDWWQGTTRTPDILPETPNPEEESRLFLPEAAGRYYFRSRGRDYAGNFEPWPESEAGDASTTIFSWYLSGQVTDGRGVPSAQQSITLQPAAMTPIVTDPQGAFQVRIGEPGIYALAQEFDLQMDQDRTKRYYRLPADNILQNGGFEQPLSPHWQISGTVALTQSLDLVHTGSQAVQLGNGCLASCLVTLEQSGIGNSAHQFLFIAPNGILHHFAVKAPSTLIHQMRTPDGRWLPYVALANGVGSWNPAALFDRNGDLHLVWSALAASTGNDDTLTYARYHQGQGWSQPELLGVGTTPKLAIDEQQQLHLLYRCTNFDLCQFSRIGYRKRTPTGSWTSAKILSANDNLVDYAIATTGNSVNISWTELNNRRSLDRLLFATLTKDGELSNRQQLEVGSTPDAGFSRYGALHLLADSQQRLHLAWVGRNEATLYYTNRTSDGLWQPIMALHPTTEVSPFDLQSVLLDREDTLHFILLRSQQLASLHWRRTVADRWLPVAPLFLFDNTNFRVTSVALGLAGELYVALQDFNPVTQIKTTATATATAGSETRQTLTIPMTLHQPTLSFLYQLNGGGDHGSAFTMSVGDEINSTTLFSTTTATDWQLGWADLTPWQGKAVTVTFQTNQAVGDDYLQVMLDRIALGSWRTPLPQALSPTAVVWGSGATLTLTGTNFIATPQVYVGERQLTNVHLVDDATLTATLPPDLAPGRYRVWVVNPEGERASAAALLTVGEAVYLPVVQR